MDTGAADASSSRDAGEHGSPGTTAQPSSRHDTRTSDELVIAIALTAILTLLLIGLITQAAAHHPHGGSRVGFIAAAVVDIALIALCGEWIRRAEHRVRRARGQPLAVSLDAAGAKANATPSALAAAAGDTPASAPSRAQKEPEHYGPGARLSSR